MGKTVKMITVLEKLTACTKCIGPATHTATETATTCTGGLQQAGAGGRGANRELPCLLFVGLESPEMHSSSLVTKSRKLLLSFKRGQKTLSPDLLLPVG